MYKKIPQEILDYIFSLTDFVTCVKYKEYLSDIIIRKKYDKKINTWGWAVMNGYLDVVKYLHENRTEGCTYWAMNYAARGGHLEVVKWLHKNIPYIGCTTDSMNMATKNGYLDVIKWLHENISYIDFTECFIDCEPRYFKKNKII